MLPDERGGAQPLRLDHRRSGEVVARPRDVARADADAQLERERTAASLAVDRPLHLDGAGEGGAGRGKRGQQAVAERLYPDRAVRGQHIAQHAVVQGAHHVGLVVTEPLAHPHRARKVGEEDRRRRAAALHFRRRLARRPAEQRGIVGEDRVLQALELGSGMQAELGVERPDRLTVGVQRLPLTAGAIEREHKLPAQALA